VGVFNYKDIYCEMKQLIRHILREHTREIGEDRIKWNTESFIEKAKEIHGDKYDYSKVKYKNNRTPVIIICPVHGEFTQAPYLHLQGGECLKCSYVSRGLGKRVGKDDFIKRANEVHGNKYDYSKVDYNTSQDKVEIICPIHGSFQQTPANHLKGQECPKCGKIKNVEGIRSNTEDFLKKAKKIHGNKYDYSQVDYKTAKSPIKIICPTHGEFEQTPNRHLLGMGCPECGITQRGLSIRRTTDDFIKQAKKVHGKKYNYDKVNYVTMSEPVKIICPVHGEFEQFPNTHLQGAGCPICQESRGERIVSQILSKNKLKYLPQHKFLDCTNKLQGRACRKLPFDFYLPNNNCCIEFDGGQHFNAVNWFGGQEGHEKQKYRDELKNQYCKKNGIKLIRIPYTMKKEEIEPYILKELGIK